MMIETGTRALLAAILFCFFSGASAEEIETVSLKRGGKISFIFDVPNDPKAGLILFVGGDGALNLSEGGEISTMQDNFLVRSREEFVAKGFMVALVDTPSDMKKMPALMRTGERHANDIVAVIKHMKSIRDLPIWLVGTSMGSVSAASVGIQKQKLISGIVLTSSVTQPQRKKVTEKLAEKFPSGILSLPLEKFRLPVLIGWHETDACIVSPPEDGSRIAEKFIKSTRVETFSVGGGKASRKDTCGGLSKHGFLGVETQAVNRIANFIEQSAGQ